jgi:hypothetical protein
MPCRNIALCAVLAAGLMPAGAAAEPGALTPDIQARMAKAANHAREKTAELTDRMASGETFGAAPVEPPPPPAEPAAKEIEAPAGETWPSKRIPADLAKRVDDAAERNGLDENFFQALVWAEGGRLGDHATGAARGPAQITRPAATEECPDLGWKAVSSQDSANLNCSARILSNRQREYLGENADPMLAAALYNTKMKHWASIADDRKVPPFKVTVSYVTRISRYYCQITGRRLLDPAKHLDKRMIALSKSVDREMEIEIEGEGQTVRPGCSPY